MADSPSNSYRVLCTAKDYTGTPLTLAVPGIVPGSLELTLSQDRERVQIMQNSNTGKAIYADVDLGLVGSQTFAGKFYVTNITSPTVASAFSLFSGMNSGTLNATAFPSWVTTAPSGHGGPPVLKFDFNFTDNSGNAVSVLIPCTCKTAGKLEKENEVYVLAVEFKIAGAITIS